MGKAIEILGWSDVVAQMKSVSLPTATKQQQK
jgi:hypothetical protein